MTVLLFTVAVTLPTGIAFGPLWRGSRVGGLQVALSVVVLTGAGLLLRTLDKLRSIDPGFDTRNVLLFQIQPSLAGYKGKEIQRLYQKVQERLTALPGVESASYSSDAPLDGSLWAQDVRVEGQADKKTVESQMLAVGPAFFSTMKIRLLAGRLLREEDMAPERRAVIVNQAFVRRFAGDRNPMGLHFGGSEAKDPSWEIAGVVSDTKYAGLQDTVAPTAFVPLRDGGATFALRTRGVPDGLISAVRNLLYQVDVNLPVIRVRTETEGIDRLLFSQRLLARLFGLCGALGLVLACIGLYGLLSYEVVRRTRESGIRTALGAQRRDMLMMVLGQGLALVIFGAAAGVGAAMAVSRLLESLLYGVRPSDPGTFAAVAGLLMVVGLGACWLPPRRAVGVDPMVALRYE